MSGRVLLASQNVLLSVGLRSLLDSESDFSVIGHTNTVFELRDLCVSLLPTLVLVDRVLLSQSMIPFLQWAQKQTPRILVIVISNTEHYSEIRRLLEYGVVGFLREDELALHATAAIRAVFLGGIWLKASITASFLNDNTDVYRPRFTHREREVLMGICNGWSNKQIASILSISRRTVEFHVAGILSKLDVNSRVEAAQQAQRRNLV